MKKGRIQNYRAAADELFMARYRGQPCEVCGWLNGNEPAWNTDNTRNAAHHVLPKERFLATRYDPRNIIVVCTRHHKFGRVAAHSSNGFSVQRFMELFRVYRPEDYDYLRAIHFGTVHPPKPTTDRQTYLRLKGETP